MLLYFESSTTILEIVGMHIGICACAAWAYIMLRQKAYRVREADQRDRVPLSIWQLGRKCRKLSFAV